MLKDRLTFANVMSMVAVFIALGGTSYAAFKLKPNSVKSVHIKDGAVAKRDLKANSVDSSKVVNGSLGVQDFTGGVFPAGPRGPQGERGATGSVDTSNFYDKATSDDRFLGRLATATNSSSLGGVPASSYAQASGGRSFMTAVGVPGDQQGKRGVDGYWSLNFSCPDPPTSSGLLQFANTSGSAVDLFIQHGGGTTHVSLPAHSTHGGVFTSGSLTTGDSVDFDAQGWSDGTILHVRVLTLARGVDCLVQTWATQMLGGGGIVP
jgi:hypothetical protein